MTPKKRFQVAVSLDIGYYSHMKDPLPDAEIVKVFVERLLSDQAERARLVGGLDVRVRDPETGEAGEKTTVGTFIVTKAAVTDVKTPD